MITFVSKCVASVNMQIKSIMSAELSQEALVVWVWDDFINFGSVYLLLSKYNVAITIVT